MRTIALLSSLVCWGLLAGCMHQTIGTVDRRSPEMDTVVPSNARIEKLADGSRWGFARAIPAILGYSEQPNLQVAGMARRDHVYAAQRLYRLNAARRRAGDEWFDLRFGASIDDVRAW